MKRPVEGQEGMTIFDNKGPNKFLLTHDKCLTAKDAAKMFGGTRFQLVIPEGGRLNEVRLLSGVAYKVEVDGDVVTFSR